MTQEEKSLLLQDLCARLLYETRVRYFFEFAGVAGITGYSDEGTLSYNKLQDFSLPDIGLERRRVVNIFPYLRPISSMTEEEYNEYSLYDCYTIYDDGKQISNGGGMDWLNAHHFDYRGLIEKGLALEAPEGMYN